MFRAIVMPIFRNIRL